MSGQNAFRNEYWVCFDSDAGYTRRIARPLKQFHDSYTTVNNREVQLFFAEKLRENSFPLSTRIVELL